MCENFDCWLKKTREALFLAPESVAQKLKVHRSTYVAYESGEQQKTITLAALSRAAEAMDCELVYAIRPKSRSLFSEIIWEKTVPEAILDPWIKNCDQRNRAGALAFLVRRKLSEAKFRSKMGWSQRANAPG